MNVSQQNLLQPLIDVLGKHLQRQFFVISIFWSIVAFIAITFIVKKFTKWEFLVPATATIFVSLLLGQFVHIPFDIINKIAADPKTFDLLSTFKAQSYNVKIVLLGLLLLWRSFTSAVAYLYSFKILTYFDKKRTYDFGAKFFLYLFAACSLPGFFAFFYLVIYSYTG